MRGPILATAMAVLAAGGCASAPPVPAKVAVQPLTDFRHLTCADLALEVARAQRAFAAAQREIRGGQAMASYYVPISLNRAPAAQATRLSQRLADLQRASRAKRCASVTLRSATA